MTDFNQDDRGTPIENLNPSGQSPSRKALSSDELIALFLAFLGIGGILFWILGQKNSPIHLNALTNGTPFASEQRNSNGTHGTAALSSDGTLFAGSSGGSSSKTSGLVAPSADPQVNGSKWTTPIAAQPNDRKDDRAEVQASTPQANLGAAAGVGVIAANPALPTNAASPVPAAPSTAASSPKGTLESPGTARKFKDVPDNFWAKDAIESLSARGVIDGFNDGTFQPGQEITRAQFAGMVQKGFEKPKTKEALKFSDLKSGYWALGAIDEATQTGFMNGYPGGVFKPDQSIPRLEMLSAIATGMDLKPEGDPVQVLSRYSDAQQLPKWAVPKVSSAVAAGITIPNTTTLDPLKRATRADAAMFIYQALIKEGKIKPKS